MNVCLIILAAGQSSRMGVPKQLLLVDGKTLVKYTAEMALDTPCFPIVCVLGAYRNLIHKELDRIPITVIDNPQWESGMASSLKMGLAGAYITQKDIEAAIIIPVDMPYISPNLIKKMIVLAEENLTKEIIVAHYQNQVGMPILIKRSLFNALLELKSDEDLDKILTDYQATIEKIDFLNGKFDLDTMEEYRNFVANYNPN